MTAEILIRGGQLVDPIKRRVSRVSVRLRRRRIAEIGKDLQAGRHCKLIDASGQLVIPGLVDAQARMCEPGYEHIATILSETRAAVAHGCTTLICPPDTKPIIDSAAAAELVVNRAIKANTARVYACGALTSGLKGKILAEMHLLKQAGCVALGNANEPIIDTRILLNALRYAATVNLPVVANPVEPWLQSGIVNDSSIATRYGLPATGVECELIGFFRLLALIEQAEVRAVIGPISSRQTLPLVREIKKKQLPVQIMTTIDHLTLSEADCASFNIAGRVMPPLQPLRDREALRAAVKEGLIDIICSDHRPWRPDDYLLPFELSHPGNSGIDTFMSLVIQLSDIIQLPLQDMLPLVTCNPARAFNLPVGTLNIGDKADVCIIDPSATWRVEEETLLSQGKNNAFLGCELPGIVKHTIKAGECVYSSAP